MICPRDQHALQESRSEGYLLHFCPECHGVFVRLNQEASPGISNSVIKPDQRPRVSVPVDEHALSPITGKPMMVIRHKGVIIDYCPDSNSVWLDAGELEKISSATSTIKDSREGSKKRVKSLSDSGVSVDAGDVVGVVLEVAVEAVGAIFTSW